MKGLRLIWIALLLVVTAGCSGLPGGGSAPTPYPPEYLPTVIALTLQAPAASGPASVPSETEASARAGTPGPEGAAAPEEVELPPGEAVLASDEPTHTPTPEDPTPTLPRITLPPSPTPTAFAGIPDALVQITRLGEMSRVVSPLPATARLTSGTGKTARADLYGEDGRLLARQVKTFQVLPWSAANLSMELTFEIRAAAEIGRLVVAVEDIHGRLMALNSVDLLLLSIGDNEYQPASALLEAIVVQEPEPLALIQGGTLTVSGLARLRSAGPLRVQLVSEAGQVVGQRVAGVEEATVGEYGRFSVEVPYSVDEPTPARLQVFEDGGVISEMAHLSSLEVMLSP